jgi:hypothetical protein
MNIYVTTQLEQFWNLNYRPASVSAIAGNILPVFISRQGRILQAEDQTTVI